MRLQVQINDNVVQKIDFIANRYGMSRSALVQFMLGVQLDKHELLLKKEGVKV